MADSLTLRLADEELVYLLGALRIQAFPPVDLGPISHLDQDHRDLALAVADRTLRARGLVRWDGASERVIDRLVAGALLECARATTTILVVRRRLGAPEVRRFYLLTVQAIVEFGPAEPGVQQLVFLDDSATLRSRIEETLAWDGEARPGLGAPSQLTHAAWQQARETAATGGEAESRHALVGLPDEMAASLAKTLSAPHVYDELARLEGTPALDARSLDAASTLVFIQGAGGAFVIENPGASHPHIQVAPLASPAATYIERFLAPVLPIPRAGNPSASVET